jgi:acetolactate decarboxylase
MKSLTIEVPDSTYESLLGGCAADEVAMGHLASAAVAKYLHEDAEWFGLPSYPPRDTGIPKSAPLSSIPLQYGDLGVGITAVRERVVIMENHLYRLGPHGLAVEIAEGSNLPYAMIVNFNAENLRNDFGASSIEDLVNHCEVLRLGKNMFYALRVDGTFRSITLGSSLTLRSLDHTAEAEWPPRTHRLEDVKGTLIGFWSSRFTGSVCTPGYHFYFLSGERNCGGVVVDCAAVGLRMLGMPVTHLRLICPDTPVKRERGPSLAQVSED